MIRATSVRVDDRTLYPTWTVPIGPPTMLTSALVTSTVISPNIPFTATVSLKGTDNHVIFTVVPMSTPTVNLKSPF